MSDSQSRSQQGPKLSVTPETAMGQYANFVSIAHNYAEVLVDFGRTLPGRNDIPVVARVIMNPFQAKQMLRALSHNLEMYEKLYGPIADGPPGAAAPANPDGTN
ncbi:MAG: DUF3467 domain-containing protein [bacterium]|nr:DUF3467 domain-containing protein [bacterium]